MSTLIYSEEKVKGIKGCYASPRLFNGDTESCDLVYTDDENILKAYRAKGIEAQPLTVKKTIKKK